MLQYGNPPHVSDAIQLVAEAWELTQPKAIASCWRCAKCLPPQLEGDVSHDTPVELECAELAQQVMQHKISQLNPEAPSTLALFKANGLNDLTIAAGNLQSAASDILHQWLCLEEEADLVIEDDHAASTNDDDEEGSTTEEELRPLQKVAILQEVLALVHQLHKLGVELRDSTILNESLIFCQHVIKETSSITTPK